MPTPERMSEINEELKVINRKLAEYNSVLKNMPGGCSCNTRGKRNNAAKDAYKRDVINPLKNKLIELNKEREG